MYRNLSSELIISTVAVVRQQIEGAFPGSGLAKVAREFHDLTVDAAYRVKAMGSPNWWMRLGLMVPLIGMLVGVVLGLSYLRLDKRNLFDAMQFIQTADAGFNAMLVLGAGLYSLVSIERKMKRSKALAALHELRSLCHIVDMHQIEKDPESIAAGNFADDETGPTTLQSLCQYFDYCSDLHALISKVAALYGQKLNDPVALNAVDQIEMLATGLSRKIWQKRLVLDQVISRS